MNVLAIDTASVCSVAVMHRGRPAVVRRRDIARGHAEVLVPMIGDAMAEAGLTFDALDLVAAAVGPGSFTGLRTGLAAARGLALAVEKPTHGISSFAATAFVAAARRPILIALESKRAEIYVQAFDAALHPMTEPMLRRPEDIAPLLPSGIACMAGDAAERLRARLAAEIVDVAFGDAAAIATIAAAEHQARVAGLPLRPLYLSPPLAMASAGAR